jgi:molybdenum cofactor cytidylyltransferase
VIRGIVLAAGDSVRMRAPKAVLPAADGRPFVARIVQTLRAAGVANLAVVTGRDHEAVVDALRRAAQPAPPIVVRNPDPSRGQLSSLWLGMDAVLDPVAEGLLVTLVDVPMLAVPTVTAVIDAWRRTRAPIVRPAIGDRHGHPVIFDRALFDELRRAPIEAGAKSVVRAHEPEILNVAVDDEGCLTDVDTPEDYRRMTGRDVGY